MADDESKTTEEKQIDSISSNVNEGSSVDINKANQAINNIAGDSSSSLSSNDATHKQQHQQLTTLQQRSLLNKIKVNQHDVDIVKNEFMLDDNEATYQLRLANADLITCINNLLSVPQALKDKLQQIKHKQYELS